MPTPAPTETFETPVTELFGIKYPILLAGMNVAAGPALAAAVTNAGGLGVIGGLGYTPKQLRMQINEIKADLKDKSAPFGVDLLLPQVGGNARKTNTDYTKGQLPELLDIIIEERVKLFVSAVGVPPKWAVDKLHAAGIPVMNMVGAPKHVEKALNAGVDIICAQGGEGGGHTGDVATSILIPAVVDACRGRVSSLTGKPIMVIAAGGIFDGRGLAMALSLGAQAVWVGTRFICATEAGAPPIHQKGVINAGYHDTIRTIIYTGRPLRILKNWYAEDFEENRPKEIKEFASRGVVPVEGDMAARQARGDVITPKQMMEVRPMLMGQAAAQVKSIVPAAEIVNSMMAEAIQILRSNVKLIKPVMASRM